MADANNSIAGPEVAAIELRCRWGARVVTGKSQLPPVRIMNEYIDRELNFFKTECAGRPKVGRGICQAPSIQLHIYLYPLMLRLSLISTWNRMHFDLSSQKIWELNQASVGETVY